MNQQYEDFIRNYPEGRAQDDPGVGTDHNGHNRTPTSEDRPPWEQEDRTKDRKEMKQTSRRK